MHDVLCEATFTLANAVVGSSEERAQRTQQAKDAMHIGVPVQTLVIVLTASTCQNCQALSTRSIQWSCNLDRNLHRSGTVAVAMLLMAAIRRSVDLRHDKSCTACKRKWLCSVF